MRKSIICSILPILITTLISTASAASVGIDLGRVEAMPPLPNYLGETVREMIATKLISSHRIRPCSEGEKCQWRLEGSLKGGKGIELRLHLVDKTTGKELKSITITAADEAALPGALTSLPLRLSTIIEAHGGSSAATPPRQEPISRLHPDRLMAEMEEKREAKVVSPATVSNPKATAIQSVKDTHEDEDGAAVPDYPIPEEAPTKVASLQHHPKRGEKRPSRTHKVLTTPPYPTPEDVFAPKPLPTNKASGVETEIRPLWSRILIWPLRLFKERNRGTGEMATAQKAIPERGDTPQTAQTKAEPASEEAQERPEHPGAKGPIWQWY